MAAEKINIERWLELAEQLLVLDVRSPGEYNQAHIPGAYSLPLFSNEERKVVGTQYKQQSREAAIKTGLDFFGPKMRPMVDEVEKMVADVNLQGGKKQVLVHCWRGGMRSAAVAWLLDLYGFKVYTLAGGYKAFRNWVLKQFALAYPFIIIGGYTGSGKTEALHALAGRQAVIDLEALASHKGSAFGNIGMPPQPSQEMFENRLAMQLYAASAQPCIWLEDESQRIGTVNIPQAVWQVMRCAPVYFLDIPFEERLQHIVSEYGALDRERVRDAITRLQKRLGGLEAKTALMHLEENKVTECFRVLLKYYDRYYVKGLNNRNNLEQLLTKINCSSIDAASNAAAVMKKLQTTQTIHG